MSAGALELASLEEDLCDLGSVETVGAEKEWVCLNVDTGSAGTVFPMEFSYGDKVDSTSDVT